MSGSEHGIKSVFEKVGITVMMLADMLMISRPTVYRYYNWFDEGQEDKLPRHVLDLFLYASGPDVSKQDIFDHLIVARSDILSSKRISPKGILKAPADTTDPYVSYIEDFRVFSPGDTLSDGTVVKDASVLFENENKDDILAATEIRRRMDAHLKSYISGTYADTSFYYSIPDHAYVACFEPPTSDDSRRWRFLYLQIYLQMIRRLIDDDLIKNCELTRIADLARPVDEAVEIVSYLMDHADLDDPLSFISVVDELNRPTFDISLPKSWYVCLYVVVVVDDYPDESYSTVYINMVEAVNADDAWAVSKRLYRQQVASNVTVYDRAIFGPFDDEDDCRRVYDYLSMDWDSNFSGPIEFTTARNWLGNQENKAPLRWLREDDSSSA